MKTNYYRILFPIALLLLAASCKKKEASNENDPSLVTIASDSPTSSELFHKGDTVNMHYRVVAPFELHGYAITITDRNTNAVIFDMDEHVHDDHFELNQPWVDTLSERRDLMIQFTVEVDHNGHSASTLTPIESQP